MERTLTLGLYCLLVFAASTTTLHQVPVEHEEHALHALDCRRPTKIQTGLVSDVCGNLTKLGDEDKVMENTLILQKSKVQVLKAVRCKKQYNRYLMYCGAYSHMKLVESPSVHEPVPFTVDNCQLCDKGLYKREDGTTVPVQKGQILRYTFLKHGKINLQQDNVNCVGSTFNIQGEEHKGFIEYISAEVQIQEVDIEVSPDEIQDLDANIKLPYSCGQDYTCIIGPVAYVLTPPEARCHLYSVRSMMMEKVRVKTQEGMQNAIVSHDHKLMFIVKDQYSAGPGCEALPVVYHTNYEQIKIVFDKDIPVSINELVAHLLPSILDIDLEVRITDEYLAYKIESLLTTEVQSVSRDLCNMNKHNLKSAEVSPFHPNSLIRISGEIITEVQCEPIIVRARIGDKRSESCNADLLPVWYNNQPVWLQSITRLIVKESEVQQIDCGSQFLPAFHTDSGVILQAAPQVQKIEVQLTHIGESYLHHDEELVHETFEKDLLYSSDEIAKFNSLIHFSRSKHNIIASLTDKYCSKGTCGAYTPSAGGSSFSLQNLEDAVMETFDIWTRIKHIASEYGGLCGLILMILTVCNWIYRCMTMCHLYFGHSATANEAMQMTFNLNGLTRQRILRESGAPQQSQSDRETITTRKDKEPEYVEMRFRPPPPMMSTPSSTTSHYATPRRAIAYMPLQTQAAIQTSPLIHQSSPLIQHSPSLVQPNNSIEEITSTI